MRRSVPFLFLLTFFLCQINAQQLLPEKNYPGAKPVFSLPEEYFLMQGAELPLTVDAAAPIDLIPFIAIEDFPRPPFFIMGIGEAAAEELALFLLSENSNAGREFAEALAAFYICEAGMEGINHDIAFAQMCLETGFLRFGGLVSPDMNNFCGLGSIGPGEPGLWFPSVELGVRAHIQHLKAYASEQPLAGDLVDPRYRFVRRGSSPVLQGLSGTWAADIFYADKIEIILGRLFRFKAESQSL